MQNSIGKSRIEARGQERAHRVEPDDNLCRKQYSLLPLFPLLPNTTRTSVYSK